MLRIAILFISLWTTEGFVCFSNSMLYDESDLQLGPEFPLKCQDGCYVYASLRENVDEQFESSIVIRDNKGKVSHSLGEIARSYDASQQMRKRFIDLPKTDGQYSIVRTRGNLADTKPVAIYVVSKQYYDKMEISPPTVFEPRIQQSASISTQQVVFLSAEPFTLTGVQLTKKNRVRIFASGPDTIRENECTALYDEESVDHAGLVLPMRSPIITVSTQENQPIHFTVSPKLESVALTSGTKTIITSPGYMGCPGSGGEIFYWSDAETSINQTFEVDVVRTINVDYDVFSNDPVRITGDKTDIDFLFLSLFSIIFGIEGNRESNAVYNSRSLKVEWTKTKNRKEYFGLRIRVNGTAQTFTSSSTSPVVSSTPASPILSTCGQTPVQPNLSTERIVGGQTAVPYSWPWQIVLCTTEWFGGCSLECGGTVIDNGWIMTAGHCVYDDMNPKNYQVKAAIYKEDSTSESGEQISNVKAIHLNPNYVPLTRSYDISLIELATPLKYTDHVQPVCLPADDTAAIAKPNSAYVTGWGTTTGIEQGEISIQLRQVKVPFVDYETCENEYPGMIFENSMVCAGVEGMDSCQRDAGGPMVVQGLSRKWFQVGIVSFGSGCGEKGKAGIYSRVTAFCDFISSTTSGKALCQPIA